MEKPCTIVSALRLCRTKKKAQGEGNATAISNLLPFLEYELHTQLMNKLKLRSMNALFGLRIQISVGENMLLGLAVRTAATCNTLSVKLTLIDVLNTNHSMLIVFGMLLLMLY